MNRCIGQNVLCVGNVQQTILDCFVLEAFREYRDDLRDHMSDNTQNRPKSELRKIRLSVMGVFDWAVSWSTLKSWSTFRIRLVLHEISWSTKDVSRNSDDIFREVNHVMALLRQLRRCSSRQVLQILINSK